MLALCNSKKLAMAATCPFWSGQEISRTAVWRMATPGKPGGGFFAILTKNPPVPPMENSHDIPPANVIGLESFLFIS